MSLFGAIVRTAVNVATLPVAVAKDVVLVGAVIAGEPSATGKALERLKREADEE